MTEREERALEYKARGCEAAAQGCAKEAEVMGWTGKGKELITAKLWEAVGLWAEAAQTWLRLEREVGEEVWREPQTRGWGRCAPIPPVRGEEGP